MITPVVLVAMDLACFEVGDVDSQPQPPAAGKEPVFVCADSEMVVRQLDAARMTSDIREPVRNFVCGA